jgi:hypothetical protein
VAIAAFHRIKLPEKVNVEEIRMAIAEHIISGHCTQFSDRHASSSLPPGISLPDCADVCDERRLNSIHPDLQIHILSALNGTKLNSLPLRRLLSVLKIEYHNSESVREE